MQYGSEAQVRAQLMSSVAAFDLGGQVFIALGVFGVGLGCLYSLRGVVKSRK